METVSAASTLVEVGCEGECKEKKGKQRAILMHLILTLFLILLGVNTYLIEENKNENVMTASDFIQWKEKNLTSPPISTYHYVDKYPLGDEVYVRICHSKGNVTLDFRRFKQEDGTMDDGIQISKMQWQYLKRSVDHKDFSMLNMPV